MNIDKRRALATEPLFTGTWDGRLDEQPSMLRLLLGREAYCVLRAGAKWLQHEFRGPAATPYGRRFEMWRRGFFAESAVMYDLPRNDPRDYVSDFQYHRMIGRINEWDGLYNHKMALRAFLLAMGFRQSPTVAYLLEGRIFAEPFSERARYVSPGECLALLQVEGARYVVKPEAGSRGEGLFLMECREGRLLRRRGRETQPFDLLGFLDGVAAGPPQATLIERWVEQGPFWDHLFPETANTLRMLTLWHPDDPAPFLARAVQRVGTSETIPADHWLSGGICVPIDAETGRLGVGRLHPNPKEKATRCGDRVERHPDTGAQITGGILPCWSRIGIDVLRAAAGVPFNPMTSWDVLVDRDDVPVIIEGNSAGALGLLQVHGGLLADPRVRRFYQAYGVV